MSGTAWFDPERGALKERVRAATNLRDLVGETVDLRRVGREWTGCCPFHEDSTPSFSVNDDKGVWHCHACKIGGDCFDFVTRRDGVLFADALKLLAERAGISKSEPHDGQPVRHVYRDASGASVLRVSRCLDAHGKTRRKHSGNKDIWRELFQGGQWRLPKDVPDSLKPDLHGLIYNMQAAIEAAGTGQEVHVGEGEGVTDALIALGFAATTNAGGAGKWTAAHAEHLRGARAAVIWADHDQVGEAHAHQVAESLTAVGVSAIRVVRFDGKPEHYDFADWLMEQRTNGRDDQLIAEMAREIAEKAAESKPGPPPNANGAEPGQNKRAGERRGWAAAQDVHDFVNAVDPEADWLVPKMIARGAVTCWNSPRGLGKTLVAHALAVDIARRGHRVLLIDRDNPSREVRRRLRAWGLDALGRDHLRVLTREDAPPLTDSAAWRSFPLAQYDTVILDSMGSASEGVGEQDSARPSLAVASLLDVVRATKGPAALVLDNTNKSGTHGRGSGVIEDRLDIVYEVRDLTGFVPSGKRDWWLELPASGRDAWADRASRRKRRDTYRLAFVPSKFRVGQEPDPFVFQVSCAGEPWMLEEVTAELVQEGKDSHGERLATAVAAMLKEARAAWMAGSPWTVNEHAVPVLERHGISRDEARALVQDRAGRDWQITGSGKRGDPRCLEPLEGRNPPQETPAPESSCHSQSDGESIPAGHGSQGPQEMTATEPAIDAKGGDGRFPAEPLTTHPREANGSDLDRLVAELGDSIGLREVHP
jgi:hypothetical protein